MIETLYEGLSAMLLGMGTVLAFLCLMIISMYLMSLSIKYLNKICPEPLSTSSVNNKKNKSSDEEEVALAVAIAMSKSK